MEKEGKDLLARALDMTEDELRSTLITIITQVWHSELGYIIKRVITDAIDLAYNPARRTGAKGW